jgi:hypothetical protein
VPGLKYLVGHYIVEALESLDKLQHECTTVHQLKVGYLLEHPQRGAVPTQVLELLEHEQPPLLLASFLACYGVRLTRRATIVDVASWQASNVDEAQVTVDSRSRVLGGEYPRDGCVGVEATSAGAAEVLERQRKRSYTCKTRVVGEEGGRVDEGAAEGRELVAERSGGGGSSGCVGCRGRRVSGGALLRRPTYDVGGTARGGYLALAARERGRRLAKLLAALGQILVYLVFARVAVHDDVVVKIFFGAPWQGGAEGYASGPLEVAAAQNLSGSWGWARLRRGCSKRREKH